MPTLHFKGKTFVQNHHLAVKYHQLVPKKELSLTDKVSLHDNLIIQGDNLKALKALLPTYSGKVKCIYIDPPYNTGNEKWVYNDNVNSPMIQEWLGSTVDKEDLTRHDKWLCMMMPRLKLLRELLSEDGAIFISIDDNEQHRLRNLLDEIFGEDNFVSVFPWRKRTAKSDVPFGISQDFEWVICYAKNDFLAGLSSDRKYQKSDDYPNDRWRLTDLTTQRSADERPNSAFEMVNPKTGKSYPFNPKRVWAVTKDTFQDYYDKGKIVFPDDYDFLNITIPAYRVFESEDKQKAKEKYGTDHILKAVSTNFPKEIGMSQDGNKELVEIFGDKHFSYPKPSSLVKYLISILNDKNSIVLDSFAGSGTTAHATLELNKEDGGNRKFVLVEMEDYANSITAERIRRVIKGVKTAKSDLLKKGTGGSFSYFELGDTIEMESLLRGKNLPSYTEFARYLFYTATGEEFNEKAINEKTGFIGESKNYEVYLFYKADIDWLKKNALTLELCKSLPKFKNKQRLVFAPAKYVDDHTLLDYRIDFCQLPYEIYRLNR